MKRLLLLISVLLHAFGSRAQSLSHFSTGSGSGAGNIGSTHLEWSIGQMTAVSTMQSNPLILSQGFLQPDEAHAFPVKLIYFNGKAADGHNELHWSTSEETNNSHFEVQKSADGRHFGTMAEIPGSGTFHSQKTYEATDESPYTHTYYRLKQVDYDGSFSFSSIIHIRQVADTRFALHPNPTADMLYLSVSENNRSLHLTVFNNTGLAVLRQITAPGAPIALSTRELPAGMYLVRITGPFSEPVWSGRFQKR